MKPPAPPSCPLVHSNNNATPSASSYNPTDNNGNNDNNNNNDKINNANNEINEADLYGACRPVKSYQKLNQIGEGAYGTVYRGVDKSTGKMVALKRVILHNEKQDGFPLTSLREIRMLKLIGRHPNCVRLEEIAVGRKRDGVFLVFEYCEHDMAHLIDHMNTRFTSSEVKNLMLQLLRGVAHLHEHWIIHRDIKMSNLLYTNTGCLKLADFGLARLYGAPPAPMTPKVVTLWYRAPELLLGSETYDIAIDMWAVGCILGELMAYEPLLAGSNELMQLEKIFELLGSPNERIWPGVERLPHIASGMVSLRGDKYPYNTVATRFPHLSDGGVDLMNSLLAFDPMKRLTATDAQRHIFFTEERPYPKEDSLMPTYASRHDEMEAREKERARVAEGQKSSTGMLLKSDFFASAPSSARGQGGGDGGGGGARRSIAVGGRGDGWPRGGRGRIVPVLKKAKP